MTRNKRLNCDFFMRLVFLALWTPVIAFAEITLLSDITDIGNKQNPVEYVRNFNVDKIPAEPKLRVKFKVKSTGSCPATYEATTFFLNGDSFAELDFRDYKLGDDRVAELEIPEGYLVVGQNKLKVITGACDEGVDSMSMNNISITQ